MIQWKLSSLLAAHNLTAYRLAEEAKGIVNRNTVYSIARGQATRVDLGTLSGIIKTLERLTGHAVTPNDLLEIVEEPALKEMDSETREWLDNTGADTLERIQALEKDVPAKKLKAWHESMAKAAKPAKYVVGKGIVLLEVKA